MPDREKIIYDIERCTCHVPDACRDCSHYTGTVGFECMEDLLKDALELLKEQENEIDVSIPEQFWPSMRYDPSEDVVACTSCLICGKDIPLRRYESGPRVCSECKEAVTAMKRGD